jgi:hypothetical protein
MNKKIVLFSALLCMLVQCAFGTSSWLEMKPSYFFFSASPMKHIYDNGGFQIQGSVSVPICNYFDLYGSVGHRTVHGRALNSCEKTNLTVMPIDIGLKPIFKLCERLSYFAAIGPRVFRFHQHNRSPYVDCKINGTGVGLFINAGFNAIVKNCLLLGVFGEYSYEKKKVCPKMTNVFSNGSVQIGGFAFGASIGYAF